MLGFIVQNGWFSAGTTDFVSALIMVDFLIFVSPIIPTFNPIIKIKEIYFIQSFNIGNYFVLENMGG